MFLLVVHLVYGFNKKSLIGAYNWHGNKCCTAKHEVYDQVKLCLASHGACDRSTVSLYGSGDRWS